MIKAVSLFLKQWHAWRERSVNRRIFAASLLIGACTLLVNLAVFVRELFVAQHFGTGDALDAFLIAYLVPSFAISVVAGTFSSAFIPTFIQVQEREGREAAIRLFSKILSFSLVVLLCMTIILGLLAKPLLAVLASGFDAEKLALTQALLIILLPGLLFNGLTKMAGAVLNAGEAFALTALAPLLTPALATFALLLGGGRFGIHALAWGTLAGFLLEAVVVSLALRRVGISVRLQWGMKDSAVQQVRAQYLPVAAGAMLMTGAGVIDQAMAAMLAPGSVAALGYGNKVAVFIIGLASMSLGTAVFPHFSRMAANADWRALRHTFRTYARLIIGVTIPLTLLLCYFSEPLVRLIYERGAFSEADTKLVGRVQAFYLLQTPFHLLGILGVRMLSALAKNQKLLRITAINLGVNVAANYIFMRFMGVAGISLSTSLVYLVSMSLILWTLHRELARHEAAHTAPFPVIP